jgi:molybdopterin converting factor small subunit
MKVNVYAVLKEYFDPSFQVPETLASVEQVKEQLIRINPKSSSVLQRCRFAVNDEFVKEDFKISAHDVISVLPPASGG